MSLITASNLAKSFHPVDVFAGVSLSIPKGARIAIVGPNGVGKTTLIRILIGLDEPTAGSVQRARGIKIGYLPQEALLAGTHTVWEECLVAFRDLQRQGLELSRLEGLMSDPEQADQAMEQYGRLQLDFEHAGGYTYELHIRQVLSGLGFEPKDFHRPIPQLSGGQRTRLVLARLLLSSPDLLVLDEPTNHLDIHAVEWLESYLSEWTGATLIVSHDRYFLDRVVDHIWELQAGGVEKYWGNYSAYLHQRQERWELRRQLYETSMERLHKELEYIKKNISGQNVSQAKGRLRRLSREVEAIEQLGFEAAGSKNWLEVSGQASISEHMMSVDEVEWRLKALRGPSNRPPHLRLNLKASNRSGDLVLRTRNLEIGYADEEKVLFTSPDLLLKRGECAAVIGPNGAGKTTFLKTLLGEIPPLRGEIILGASLHVGYFAQAHEGLNPENTLVQEIDNIAPHLLLSEIRDYLARYLFGGEDVFRKVKTLSGGERGRLALAKLGLTQANLLLLDEPTNHLDIPAQEILQGVLADYAGTILLVSHDRYLIDALGTQIWEIKPNERSLSVFEGTYSQYRVFQEEQKLAQRLLTQENDRFSSPSRQAPERSSQADRRRKARLKEVEERVTHLEILLAELAQQLEKPPVDLEVVERMGQDYVRIQQELDDLIREWEALQS